MKSRKDFDRNKAIVERYERKAKMYYSNHPKIKMLLAEIDAEMKVAESKLKSAKRKETTISILKNRWLWIALLLVIAILMMIIGNSMGRDGEMIALLGFLLLAFVAAYAFLFIAIAIHR